MDSPPADSVIALAEAVTAIGLPVSVDLEPGRAADLLVNVGGQVLEVKVKRLAVATPPFVRDLVHRGSSGMGSAIHVLVADRITAASRSLLREHGWSWLDRRGHIHLAGPGLFVDTDVDVGETSRRPRSALYGTASVEVACELLMRPDKKPSVRDLARTLGRSPSTISEALAGLRDHGLLNDAGAPLIPALFWETAESWQPSLTADLARQPEPDQRLASALRLNFEHPLQGIGWALTDSRAAAAYGAPIVIGSAYPPDFYVPDKVVAQRAIHLLNQAANSAARGARIRVAPTKAVCSRRVDLADEAGEEFPLAHPLFVALDLAADPTRGKEVLDGWTPPREFTRVW
jgi:hypothetical protein